MRFWCLKVLNKSIPKAVSGLKADGSAGASSKGSTGGEGQTPLGEGGNKEGVTPIPKDQDENPARALPCREDENPARALLAEDENPALLLSCSRIDAGSPGDARGAVHILAGNFPSWNEPLLSVFTLSYIWWQRHLCLTNNWGDTHHHQPCTGTCPGWAQGVVQAHPSLGMCPASIPVPAIPPSASSSFGRTEFFCSALKKIPPPGPGCVLEARPVTVTGDREVTVTMPGGMAGARPEPPEEGTKPGPALSLPCPCSAGKHPWEYQKNRGATASVEKKYLFFFSLLAWMCNSSSSEGRGDISRVAPVPTLPWGRPHWDGTDWPRTWTRPPVTCINVKINCLWPRCFSRAAFEQKILFHQEKKKKKNPPDLSL